MKESEEITIKSNNEIDLTKIITIYFQEVGISKT